MNEIDYNINNYKKHSLKHVIFKSPKSVMNYKIAIWWIPMCLYIFTMIILYVTFNTFGGGILLEIIFSLISFIIYFIIYFTTDIIYQSNMCTNLENSDIIMISVQNAINIAKFVGCGYFLGVFITDNTRGIMDISTPFNSQFNNLITSIIGIIFGMFYINPLNRDNCSENIICKPLEKKVETKKN